MAENAFLEFALKENLQIITLEDSHHKSFPKPLQNYLARFNLASENHSNVKAETSRSVLNGVWESSELND